MTKLEKVIAPIVKDAVSSLSLTEDIIIEAVQDLVREEIKRRIKERLKKNPALKREINDAIKLYLEAKAKEAYAGLRLAKAGAKLGLEIMPEDLKKELSKEFLGLLEKELSELMEKTL